MKKKSAKRLDLLLVEQDASLTRSRAQAEIMAGRVLVDGQVCDKPGALISLEAQITIEQRDNQFVSRGGLKLTAALDDFELDVKGLVVLDVGASTGGFTDCLLQRGATRVYALDVGYGQLAWKLRQDPRVVVMERFNVRNLTRGDLEEVPDLAVIDVSFISLKNVIPVLHEIKIPELLALVKPQFEAGRTEANKGKGVIRDPRVHTEVLIQTAALACREGYCSVDMTYSPWPGPKGNLEFFLYLQSRRDSCCCPADLENKAVGLIEQAHQELEL